MGPGRGGLRGGGFREEREQEEDHLDYHMVQDAPNQRVKARSVPVKAALDNLAFVESDEGMYFHHLGKMAGSLHFGHVSFDIDVNAMYETAKASCEDVCSLFKTYLRKERAVEYILDQHTMVEVKRMNLVNKARDMNGLLQSSLTKKKKKQASEGVKVRGKWKLFFGLGLVVGAGLMALGSYLFSSTSLLNLSVSASGLDSGGTIQVLKDHQWQLTLKSNSLNKTKLALLEIGERIGNLREEIEIVRLVQLVMAHMDMIHEDLYRVLWGLEDVSHQDTLMELYLYVPPLMGFVAALPDAVT